MSLLAVLGHIIHFLDDRVVRKQCEKHDDDRHIIDNRDENPSPNITVKSDDNMDTPSFMSSYDVVKTAVYSDYCIVTSYALVIHILPSSMLHDNSQYEKLNIFVANKLATY